MDAPRDEQKTPNLETLASDVTNFCDGIGRLANAASVWLQTNGPAVEAFIDRLPALIKGLPEYELEQAVKAKALAEAGWCLPATEPLDFVSIFHKMLAPNNEKKGQERLDKELTAMFAVGGESYQRLHDFLLSDEIPTEFRRLLEECLMAHKNEMYHVAVAGLFTAIDGMMAECIESFKKTRPSPKRLLERSAYYKALEKKRKEKDLKEKIKNLASLSLLPVPSSLFAFLDKAYVPSPCGESPPEFVNRHRVAHGCGMIYGTEPNSLKLLVAVSTILWFSEQQAEHEASETNTDTSHT